jgi:hypothetical protein
VVPTGSGRSALGLVRRDGDPRGDKNHHLGGRRTGCPDRENIMRRRTFDGLMATTGLVLAAVLLVAGGLLTWAHTFVSDQVREQLVAQKILFPPAGEAIADPAIKPYLSQYAGQQLTTGPQAKAYADHYIAVHIKEMSGGRSYSELSTASRAAPDDTELAGLVQTVFRGETLRGLLLNAYAFDTMGRIALYSAIASFVGAGIMLLLSLLGLAHLRRVDPVEELGTHRQPVPATA